MWPIVVALLVAGLVGAQFLVGFGVVGPTEGRPGFRRLHGLIAAATALAFLAHDALPLMWLKRPALLLHATFVLPAGLVVLALFVAVVLVGLRVRGPSRERVRSVHIALATSVAVLGLLHGLLVLGGFGYPMKAPCTACHRPPAAHPPISCEACHRHPGIAW